MFRFLHTVIIHKCRLIWHFWLTRFRWMDRSVGWFGTSCLQGLGCGTGGLYWGVGWFNSIAEPSPSLEALFFFINNIGLFLTMAPWPHWVGLNGGGTYILAGGAVIPATAVKLSWEDNRTFLRACGDCKRALVCIGFACLNSLDTNAGGGPATPASVFVLDIEACASLSFALSFAPHSLCLPLDYLVTE